MKRFTTLLFLPILALLTIFSCKTVPPNTHTLYDKIETGFGPEDMILDTVITKPRLLVSCDGRRAGEHSKQGSIYEIDLATDQSKELPRVGEPSDIVFHPHGIDFVCANGQCFLYVTSHLDKDKEKGIIKDKHFVHKYEVSEKELRYQQTYQHSLFTSPNAVAAQADGSFFVSNDAHKRGSLMELMLKKKKSKVIYCDGQDSYTIAADRLGMGNGIALRDGYAYVATTRQSKLFRYKIDKGQLTERKELIKLKGQDNIRFYGDDIILPIHLKDFAFIKHANNKDKPSPSVIYQIPIDQPTDARLIYSNKGEQISASATGIIYNSKLYISQVFDPFILKVDYMQ